MTLERRSRRAVTDLTWLTHGMDVDIMNIEWM